MCERQRRYAHSVTVGPSACSGSPPDGSSCKPVPTHGKLQECSPSARTAAASQPSACNPALGAHHCLAPEDLGTNDSIERDLHPLPDGEAFNLTRDGENPVEILQTVHVQRIVDHVPLAASRSFDTHPVSLAGREVEHVIKDVLAERMADDDQGAHVQNGCQSARTDGQDLPDSGEDDEASQVQMVFVPSGHLEGDACKGADHTSPLNGHSNCPSAEAVDMADRTAHGETPATQSFCACFGDEEARTGSSLNVTPPIAAVTPSKQDNKAQKHTLLAPGLSLSDASVRPAARGLQTQALASVASTASFSVARQDHAREGIHVSRLLIGHQNPLYISSPVPRSGPCSPVQLTDDNHADAHSRVLVLGSPEQMAKPGSAAREHSDNDCKHGEPHRTVADLTRVYQFSARDTQYELQCARRSPGQTGVMSNQLGVLVMFPDASLACDMQSFWCAWN